jgi:biotin transport system substrate-specific component
MLVLMFIESEISMSLTFNTSSIRVFSIANDRAVARFFWIFTFAVLTAVGAQLEIPHAPVPFTAQTFFVLLAGAVLGPWNGAASMLLYVALGAVGLPVFSGLSFGLARIMGPTGGYLLAFPVAAMVVGFLVNRSPSLIRNLCAMAAGLLVIFSMGTVQLWAVAIHNFREAFGAGFLIFSWWDALKLIAASSIASQMWKRTRHRV